MRIWCAATAAFALFATQALAAETGPLAPGQPAGTAKAQDADADNTILYILGAGAIIAGVALLASSDNHNSTPTAGGGGTTTTTTTTT